MKWLFRYEQDFWIKCGITCEEALFVSFIYKFYPKMKPKLIDGKEYKLLLQKYFQKELPILFGPMPKLEKGTHFRKVYKMLNSLKNKKIINLLALRVKGHGTTTCFNFTDEFLVKIMAHDVHKAGHHEPVQ